MAQDRNGTAIKVGDQAWVLVKVTSMDPSGRDGEAEVALDDREHVKFTVNNRTLVKADIPAVVPPTTKAPAKPEPATARGTSPFRRDSHDEGDGDSEGDKAKKTTPA